MYVCVCVCGSGSYNLYETDYMGRTKRPGNVKLISGKTGSREPRDVVVVVVVVVVVMIAAMDMMVVGWLLAGAS